MQKAAESRYHWIAHIVPKSTQHNEVNNTFLREPKEVYIHKNEYLESS